MSSTASDRSTEPPIVLIHGMWMTPLSWEHWASRYRERGHQVLTPAWPGLEGEPEEIRRDPSPLQGLSIPDVIDHYEKIIRELGRPPIIIGHSFGGLYAQLLLNRGLGSNALSREDSDAVYERYYIPGSARPFFQAGYANFNPNAATKVDYRNPNRPPLVLVTGAEDRICPPSVNEANFKKQRQAPTATEHKEYAGRCHYPGQNGWEDVADYILAWTTGHATAAEPKTV